MQLRKVEPRQINCRHSDPKPWLRSPHQTLSCNPVRGPPVRHPAGHPTFTLAIPIRGPPQLLSPLLGASCMPWRDSHTHLARETRDWSHAGSAIAGGPPAWLSCNDWGGARVADAVASCAAGRSGTSRRCSALESHSHWLLEARPASKLQSSTVCHLWSSLKPIPFLLLLRKEISRWLLWGGFLIY